MVWKSKNSVIVEKCITLIQSCASSASKLTQIHAFAIRRGVALSEAHFTKHLIFAAVSLSAPMSYSHTVFSLVHTPNVFAWNTLIRGYADTDCPKPSIDLFRLMRSSPTRPDTHTFPFLLKAVAKLKDAVEGEKIHSVCVKSGFDSLLFVQNALLHFYACCGRSRSACNVFDEMPLRDLVAWNTVINGLAFNGNPNEALSLVRDMASENVAPDGFTMVSLLCACAELGALPLGRRSHVFMIKTGLVDSNVIASNALIDLYAKCGCVDEAKRVFDEINEQRRTIVSWSSMVVGLAVNGYGKEAIKLFEEFKSKGLVPSEIIFVGVLLACSHCGMVEKGLEYFEKMREIYEITPRIEHYGCVVDLLGRAGFVWKAYEFIENMPMKPNAVIWRTLLGACTLHGDLNLAELARARLEELEPVGQSGDYVLLSNLYASESRWAEAQRVRGEMQSQGLWKTPSSSSTCDYGFAASLRDAAFGF